MRAGMPCPGMPLPRDALAPHLLRPAPAGPGPSRPAPARCRPGGGAGGGGTVAPVRVCRPGPASPRGAGTAEPPAVRSLPGRQPRRRGAAVLKITGAGEAGSEAGDSVAKGVAIRARKSRVLTRKDRVQLVIKLLKAPCRWKALLWAFCPKIGVLCRNTP